jgi:hypothetical protein
VTFRSLFVSVVFMTGAVKVRACPKDFWSDDGVRAPLHDVAMSTNDDVPMFLRGPGVDGGDGGVDSGEAGHAKGDASR